MVPFTKKKNFEIYFKRTIEKWGGVKKKKRSKVLIA